MFFIRLKSWGMAADRHLCRRCALVSSLRAWCWCCARSKDWAPIRASVSLSHPFPLRKALVPLSPQTQSSSCLRGEDAAALPASSTGTRAVTDRPLKPSCRGTSGSCLCFCVCFWSGNAGNTGAGKSAGQRLRRPQNPGGECPPAGWMSEETRALYHAGLKVASSTDAFLLWVFLLKHIIRNCCAKTVVLMLFLLWNPFSRSLLFWGSSSTNQIVRKKQPARVQRCCASSTPPAGARKQPDIQNFSDGFHSRDLSFIRIYFPFASIWIKVCMWKWL